MRLAIGLAMMCVACGSATQRTIDTPPPPVSSETSALAFLQCIARSGPECVTPHAAGDAWAALGELERIQTSPTPLLPGELLAASKRLSGRSGYRRLLTETLQAAKRSGDLSCRIIRVLEVGSVLLARRDSLVRAAELLGLGSTTAGPATGRIAAAVTPIGNAWLAEARCDAGDVFVLVAPPSIAVDADEDPRAHPNAGWHAFAASTSRSRLLRGGNQAPPPAPPLRDATRTGLDPWIPLSELEL